MHKVSVISVLDPYKNANLVLSHLKQRTQLYPACRLHNTHKLINRPRLNLLFGLIKRLVVKANKFRRDLNAPDFGAGF